MVLFMASLMTFVAVFALVVGLLALRPQRLPLAAQLQGPSAQPERAPALLGELEGSFRTRVATPLLAPLGTVLQKFTPAGAIEQLELAWMPRPAIFLFLVESKEFFGDWCDVVGDVLLDRIQQGAGFGRHCQIE